MERIFCSSLSEHSFIFKCKIINPSFKHFQQKKSNVNTKKNNHNKIFSKWRALIIWAKFLWTVKSKKKN